MVVLNTPSVDWSTESSLPCDGIKTSKLPNFPSNRQLFNQLKQYNLFKINTENCYICVDPSALCQGAASPCQGLLAVKTVRERPSLLTNCSCDNNALNKRYNGINHFRAMLRVLFHLSHQKSPLLLHYRPKMDLL